MNNKKMLKKELLYSLSFINALIMVFYTMIHGNGGVGVLAAIMVGFFFLIPQLLLYFFKEKKINSLFSFIFRIVLVVLGFTITFAMFSFTSDPINVFIIFNFGLLLIILVSIIKEYKEKKRN